MSNAQWAQLSNTLVYGAIAAYAVAFLALAAETAFGARGRVGRSVAVAPRIEPVEASFGAGAAPPGSTAVVELTAPPGFDRGDRLARVGMSLTVVATALLSMGALSRGLAAGRVPWANMYEFALVGTTAASITFLVVARRWDVRALALGVVTTLLLSLGLAVTVLYVPAGPLVPALQTPWLVIHVSAATIAGGLFTVAAVASVVHIVAMRTAARRGGVLPPALARPERFDALAYRVTAFAFPIWTFAVLAGAIWAEAAWGRYWGWDPKEVWAFVTWVGYAAYLHARSTGGWRGSRASWVGLAAYAALVFNFFGVNLFISGLHSYAGL